MSVEIWYALILTAIIVIFVLVFLLFHARSKASKKQPIIDLYVQGLNALVDGDIERAAMFFRESAQQNSENVDAYLKLGDIIRKQGKPDRAIKIHRELLVRRNLMPGIRLQILRSLAQDYKTARQFDRALSTLDEILTQVPKDEWALTYKLKLFEEMGEWDKASRTLKQMVRVKKFTGDANRQLALYWVEEARRLFSEGHEKQGRINLRDALKIDSKCVPAYLYWGDSYIRENRADDAVKVWKNFIETVPEFSHLAFGRLREVLFNMGKFSEFESILSDLLHKDPENLNIYYALIHIYENKGQYTEGINLCDQILETRPADADAHMLKMRLLAHKKDCEILQKEVFAFTDRIIHPQEQYACRICGYRSEQPLWHCPQCGEWNSFNLRGTRSDLPQRK
ncbi:tetratricopeptide repeat protein [bacterium BMS3Bbin03]|nr:tetratricopeptide repeat protein [bacterium BMS3Bbin03]